MQHQCSKRKGSTAGRAGTALFPGPSSLIEFGGIGLCGPVAIGPPSSAAKPPDLPSSCSSTLNGATVPQAGPQVIVSSSQTCTAASCNIQVTRGASADTTLSVSQTITTTNSWGTSITLTAGESLFGAAGDSLAVGFSYDIAKSVANEQVSSVSTSTSYSLTNTLGQPLGTTT
jgi:hypothetical protein